MSFAFGKDPNGRHVVGMLLAACVAVAVSQTASAQGFSVTVKVDENGNGLLTNTNGFSSTLPFALQNDPGPGGLPNVLTYSLLNPPGLTAGDLLIDEPGDGLGDVVRFNPGETCTDGSVGCLVFYSEGPPFDSLADTATPPSLLYPNNITLTEDATGQVLYTPVAGQPGFVTEAGGPVHYDLISDVPVPEPASFGLLGIALAGFGIARSRRFRVRAKRSS